MKGNIKLTIQYDGTNYNGWQIQKTEVRSQKPAPECIYRGSEVRKNSLAISDQQKITTIQGILQETIKKITGEDTKVVGAARTDAGVHAIAQEASFKTLSKLAPEIIKRALNANLPDDIRIIDACDTEDNFHPRYDAKSKIYFYVISNSQDMSPFFYKYAWKIPHKLDFIEMSYSLQFLRGKHNFSAFRASGCGAKNPTRTIYDISIEKLDAIDFMSTELTGNFLKIRIKANAFLRHMVRNIVGTIVEIGKGKIKSIDIKEILLSEDRRLTGPTAPARGLFLEKINY